MKNVTVGYNERSWAIDVISYINLFLNNKDLKLKKAGGESSLKSRGASTLFPDVLIYSDDDSLEIIQGWELKMPDTSITDAELIHNAKKKAILLQLDSFLIWNVNEAVLYLNSGGDFSIFKSWSIPVSPIQREDVKANKSNWGKLLEIILLDLDQLLSEGKIVHKPLIEVLSMDSIVELLLENVDSTSLKLKSGTLTDTIFKAKVDDWWKGNSSQYFNKETPFPNLSRVILVDWVIKIIFAHTIKKFFNSAKIIQDNPVWPNANFVLDLFDRVTVSSDFYNIFKSGLGQEYISDTALDQLNELSLFLTDLNLEKIDQNILHRILQELVSKRARKIAGQFATPPKLARLLCNLTITNLTLTVLDPCCGTGTIIDSASDLMISNGISRGNVVQQIWGSDKYSFPLQLASLAMTKVDDYGQIVQLFQEDVTKLKEISQITFKDPNTGLEVTRKLPKFNFIVSNFPFVKQKELASIWPNIGVIWTWLKAKYPSLPSVSNRSDLFAYIPFYLLDILQPNARVGLILSNAWLGTSYGQEFIECLSIFYNIENVIISGNGKWFGNADVVTVMVILSLKLSPTPRSSNPVTTFTTIISNLENIDLEAFTNSFLLGKPSADYYSVSYTQAELLTLESYGFFWSSFFADLKWFQNLMPFLVKANSYFEIFRGERRGWNDMFYPPNNSNIEPQFLLPSLKNLRNTKGLIANPTGLAFCCSLSIPELQKNNFSGAESWINKFVGLKNGTGRPLPDVLSLPKLHWYEFKPASKADFITNMNPDNSLFIASLSNPAIIDQRVIGFSKKSNCSSYSDLLLHALLNSTISLFMLEALGFGRGLGALDLSSEKVNSSFLIPNPALLNQSDIKAIEKSFLPLLKRNRETKLEDEFKLADRIQFEQTVFNAFGISAHKQDVENALFTLQKIRFSVK